MKAKIILIGLILSVSSLFGQANKDCKQILKKEFSLNDLRDDKKFEQFVIDFQTLIYCEFDSIDVQIFLGPQKSIPSIVRTLVLTVPELEEPDKKFTFNDIKQIIKASKKREEYVQGRRALEARNEIIQREAILENWNEDKELLIKMGLDKPYLDEIYALVRDYEPSLYSQILGIYGDTLRARKAKQKFKKKKRDALKQKGKPTTTKWGKLIAYLSYKSGMEEARALNKPVFLYFNLYGAVRTREFEAHVMLAPKVESYIHDNFVFISLFVDERTKLNEDDMYFSKILNEKVIYTGQVKKEFEMQQFHSDEQPFFILLDVNGKEIARMGNTTDVEAFYNFLKTIEK